ncbi:MAG: hypothetical protein KGL25_07815 [Gammaproteobacteria bacterium]|nr:hypothetical protein [Gammaproteobacteria bacterium]
MASLLLRAQFIGVPLMLVPAELDMMYIAYSRPAYPFGALADRMVRTMIAVGA